MHLSWQAFMSLKFSMFHLFKPIIEASSWFNPNNINISLVKGYLAIYKNYLEWKKDIRFSYK